MRGSFQAILGVCLAVLSSLVVLGSMTLSLMEGGRVTALSARTPTFSSSDTDLTGLIHLVTLTPVVPTTSPAILDEQEASPTPLPTRDCPIDPSLIKYIVDKEANLVDVAQTLNLEPDTLRQLNCLSTNQLASGQTIYYIPVPSSTPTAVATQTPTSKPDPTRKPKKTQVTCGAPGGWVIYIVRRGDTLSSLAQRLHTSVAALQAANCMGRSTLLRTGQRLYVPFLPAPISTKTPVRPTPTSPPAPTKPPEATQPPAPTQPPPPTEPPPPTQLPPPTPTPLPPGPTPTPSTGSNPAHSIKRSAW